MQPSKYLSATFSNVEPAPNLDQDAALPVPPAKAGYLGVVAVEDPGLGERRGRGHAAPIPKDLVALTVDQVLNKRHVTFAQPLLQRIGAHAVDVQDD